jgi:small GTP-binding protein
LLPQKYDALTFASQKVHNLYNVDGKNVRLQLWDNAGDPKFRAIISNYFKGVHGVVVVFDVTNEDSFLNIKQWLLDLENKIPHGTAAIAIVANKIDSAHKRVVSRDRARTFAFEHGFHYMECSALNGHNVEECFVTLATTMVDRAMEAEAKGEQFGSGVGGSSSAIRPFRSMNIQEPGDEDEAVGGCFTIVWRKLFGGVRT